MNPTGQPFGSVPQAPRNEQLNLAAILIMIAAGLALAYSLMTLATSAAGSDGSFLLQFVQDEAAKQKLREALKSGGGGSKIPGILWAFVMMGVNAFIIFGGIKMKNAQSYPVAMAAAILSVIPCCFNGCCCISSMPVGIFALVVLMKPEVKASFS